MVASQKAGYMSATIFDLARSCKDNDANSHVIQGESAHKSQQDETAGTTGYGQVYSKRRFPHWQSMVLHMNVLVSINKKWTSSP